MFKTLFTRKNLIAISLVMFYSFVMLFCGLCLDSTSAIVSQRNPIALFAKSLGVNVIGAGSSGLVTLILFCVYIIVFAVAFIYEKRYATVNNVKPWGLKMILIYLSTLLCCFILSLGVGMLIQKPLNGKNIGIMFAYIGQTFVIGTCIYALLFVLIGAFVMFVVNFILIDKPYRGSEDDGVSFDDGDLIEDEKKDISSSFDMDEATATTSGAVGPTAAVAGAGGGVGETSVRSVDALDDREKVFPTLSRIDRDYEGFTNEHIESDQISLAELATRFRNYLAKEEKLYFDIDTIRFFISGFSASHFEILEGLSGTGKSSLPRYFAKFVNGRALFMPVQTTWRDKTNILGFFNEFSRTYQETDFLAELYRANYDEDMINIFVLDEMNISRVEYYFADLLSVLEFPVEDWKLKIMQVPYDFVPPLKLEDGTIKIPENSYFVGTANKDDSTFTITDKVYDRAITTEFDYNNNAFEVQGNAEKVTLSSSYLKELYKNAIENKDFALNKVDKEKMEKITKFVYDNFDIAIGNRILTQIEKIVPVFVACGGTKESAIDFMLSKKLLCKIEGRFEEYVKGALKNLQEVINSTYGAGTLPKCEKVIKNILRTL